MKILFSIIFVGSLVSSNLSAQSSAVKLSIETMDAPTQQIGNSNYLLSASDEDFKNKKYTFYTDSIATVAYIKVNGTVVRLIGIPTQEDIMAYGSKKYTVTLSTSKKATGKSTNDNSNSKNDFNLVIYSNDGQSIMKKVTGTKNNMTEK